MPNLVINLLNILFIDNFFMISPKISCYLEIYKKVRNGQEKKINLGTIPTSYTIYKIKYRTYRYVK